MGLKGALAAAARQAPARVIPVAGRGGRALLEALRTDGRLAVLDSPRSADILLIAGELPEALLAPARSVHDAMAHPRATVHWAPGTEATWRTDFAGTEVRGDAGAALQAIIEAHEGLWVGRRSSEPDLLPDEDPAPWRGVGPYGQGGKGMTGGVPFGRPMAERAPDRDGLELDQLAVRVGPFFAPFPPGLVLDVGLQGDVIQSVAVGGNPFEPGPGSVTHVPAGGNPFRRALDEPLPVASVELARARHHLRWLASVLRTHGLGQLGRRVDRLAADLMASHAGDLRTIGRWLERSRALGWATAGVGVIRGDLLDDLPRGPVTRAAGIPDDARQADPAYIELGFEPVIHLGSDARARWRQRLAEAVQSLELAGSAGGRQTTPNGTIESPRGALSHAAAPAAELLGLLPKLLTGMEWGDAVTTVVSLDVDLEEAARSAAPG